MYSFVQQKKDVFADQLHPLAQMLDGCRRYTGRI